jgi:hypothetical protein
MIGQFFSYFIIFFLIARLTSLLSSLKWLPLTKTTIKHDVILAVIFSLVVVLFTLFN